jgi:demethylmenaquinone methyltransferase/2-methoxy-6-polyprenyl-1,4-benzoquinol methylase
VAKPYSGNEEKKLQVKSMFDRIASKYDLLNHLLSVGIDRRWRKGVRVELSKIIKKHSKKTDTIILLDVATGTGDLAFELAKTGIAEIHGVDISGEMLSVAQKKKQKHNGSTCIFFEYGDGENLKYDDQSFDFVTIAFGIRNFQDVKKGLQEMKRVLKQGGSILLLEFSKIRNPLMKGLYYLYFHGIVPLIGRLVSHDRSAYRYLPQSVKEFPDPSGFIRMLQSAGFVDCRYKSKTVGIASIYIARKTE